MKINSRFLLFPAALITAAFASAQTPKPLITLDEYFNATDFREARISPDGTGAVIATTAPDWAHNRFREDLWLWTEQSGKTIPLTQSGHDSSPEWSPDGRYIAFVSDRKMPDDGPGDSDGGSKDEGTERLWLIDTRGGEAFPVYREKVSVHAFAWMPDGTGLYFSITEPLSKDAEEAYKREWKDVVRYREQERGDVLLKLSVASAIAENVARPIPNIKPDEPAPTVIPYPKNSAVLVHYPLEIASIQPSPAGDRIAFVTNAISHRLEGPNAIELYLVPAAGGEAKQLTHNRGLESNVRWSHDGKRIFFQIPAASGSVEGKYRDVQGRLYTIDPESGKIDRLGADFGGSWDDYTLTSNDKIIAAGLTGIEQQAYSVNATSGKKLPGLPGNYGGLDAAAHSPHVIFTHSAIDEPTEIYVAVDSDHMAQAKPITSFNALFKQRAAPQWKAYKWKADDGAEIEGVLLYPPGKLDAKNLRMLTLIHGGPADADGNRFGADWYDWASLAAANGWLVFRPNYRGSSGYGDEFMLQISPHIVSRPGKDILEGVDALVKDGIADPDHLAVGGYSYGGYMTDWLITQTTRFRSAVTGAGAIENAANWGYDDETFDDAWYLGGTPWENPDIYQSEAALFQFGKVKTPTHVVGGEADIRVSYFEDVLLERALQQMSVPHTFLSFPGEGHGLGKDPWHGYIKVREELKWLDKYDKGGS